MVFLFLFLSEGEVSRMKQAQGRIYVQLHSEVFDDFPLPFSLRGESLKDEGVYACNQHIYWLFPLFLVLVGEQLDLISLI